MAADVVTDVADVGFTHSSPRFFKLEGARNGTLQIGKLEATPIAQSELILLLFLYYIKSTCAIAT
ncbi:MAG: hypothetical protein KME43_02770 [Myxacorys chilensis ATA2-1-KO14]|nr:hypothetical protein [Myxacorys chilensis ATA2-1-KO14]